jgi:hypothetical protein
MARLIEARIRDVERQATRLQGLRRRQINGERFVMGRVDDRSGQTRPRNKGSAAR